jgi:hypothetical protein
MGDWWKISKNDFKRIGKEIKRIAGDVAGVVTVINPALGIALGGISGGADGIKDTLRVAVLNNVLSGKNILNFAASGRDEAAKKLITNIVQNPEKVIANTLTSGGSLEQGLMKTAMQTSGNVSKELQAVLTNDFGGMFLNDFIQGSGINLTDPLVLSAVYEVLNTSTPKPPTMQEFELMADTDVIERMNMFKEDLDEATQERLNIIDQKMSQRGIRGGMGDVLAERAIKDKNRELARLELETKQEQLRYNNAVRQEQYAFMQKDYALRLEAHNQKIDALTGLIALSSQKDGLSTAQGIANTGRDFFRNTIQNIFKDKEPTAPQPQPIDIDTAYDKFTTDFQDRDWFSTQQQQQGQTQQITSFSNINREFQVNPDWEV